MAGKNISLNNKMSKVPQAIVDWEKCVKLAKKKLGVPVDKYGFIEKKVLLEAQRCYCAMGY